jgi:hypothetical protein
MSEGIESNQDEASGVLIWTDVGVKRRNPQGRWSRLHEQSTFALEALKC